MAGGYPSAFGQAAPPKLPSAVEPGRPPVLPKPSEDIPQADLDIEIQAPRGGQGQASEELSFDIKKVTIDGSTLLSADELDSYTQPLVGKQAGLSAITAIAEKIEARYKGDGYILSRAIVPPQSVSNGEFHIRVIEGFIKKVSVEGASPGTQANIEGIMEPAAQERPTNIATLQRSLLLIQDLPGVTATGVLRPGDEVGAADLVVTVDEKSVQGLVSLSNRDSRYSGRWTLYQEASYNSLLDFGEQLTLGFSTALNIHSMNDSLLGVFRYLQPVGSDGILFGLDGSYGASHPGYTLRSKSVYTHSYRIGPHVSYPIIRGRAENWTVDGRFTWQRSDSNINNGPLTYDVYPSFAASTTYVTNALGGSTSFNLGVTQGFDALGTYRPANSSVFPSNSRPASPEFTKFTSEIQRLDQVADGFTTSVLLLGQFAPHTVYSGEEFAVGGARVGRGYDPAEITGRDGAAVAAELRYNDPDYPWAQAYLFYDYGIVVPHLSGARPTRELMSAGTGIRGNFEEGYSGALELAFPLAQRPSTGGGSAAGSKDMRIYLDLAFHF